MSNYNSITTAEIDAKLYNDTIRNNNRTLFWCIVGYLLFFLFFHDSIFYWIRFGIAIPSGTSNVPISTENEPLQINYSESEQQKKRFIYTSLINSHSIIIIPQAKYTLSGLAVAYNHDFIFISDFFDSAALYDLGATWGQPGSEYFFKKYFYANTTKNEVNGSRVMTLYAKQAFLDEKPFSWDKIQNTFSHSHLVPANRNVMAALLKIRKYDKVVISGDLIDMQYKDQDYHTSMSRDDGWQSDRGNGSCETIFVKQVRIGKNIYR